MKDITGITNHDDLTLTYSLQRASKKPRKSLVAAISGVEKGGR